MTFKEDQVNKLYSADCSKIQNQTRFESEEHSVYGEMTQKGAEDFLRLFSNCFSDSTVFYDLGSGFGKLVCHVAINYPVKKACGIELSKERCDWARKNSKNFKYERNSPKFKRSNFLEQDLSDATIVYADLTMYPHLMIEIAKKLPKGCIFVYRGGGAASGDRFFCLETTYSKNSKFDPKSAVHFWYQRASWRII